MYQYQYNTNVNITVYLENKVILKKCGNSALCGSQSSGFKVSDNFNKNVVKN